MRQSVTFSDLQANYLKSEADRLDMSVSEVVRACIENDRMRDEDAKQENLARVRRKTGYDIAYALRWELSRGGSIDSFAKSYDRNATVTSIVDMLPQNIAHNMERVQLLGELTSANRESIIMIIDHFLQG